MAAHETNISLPYANGICCLSAGWPGHLDGVAGELARASSARAARRHLCWRKNSESYIARIRLTVSAA